MRGMDIFRTPVIAALLAAVVAFAPAPVAAADSRLVPASEAPREIAALLALLRASPCRFERNGRWYDGDRAADHLQRKLDYGIARGHAIGSTELFIEHAATASSFTGRPYHVQCGEEAKVPSKAWFLARLSTLRNPPPQ
jgi:hypothetical protein